MGSYKCMMFVTMVFWMTVMWGGNCLPVTTTPPGSSFHEDACKVYPEDFGDLLTWLKKTYLMVNSSLDLHCQSLEDADFPPPFNKNTCREFAESLGTQDVTCSRPISNPVIHNGPQLTLQTVPLEVMDSAMLHSAMLKGILDLNGYQSSAPCTNVDQSTVQHFICKLKTAVDYMRRPRRITELILSDLETPEGLFPEAVTCEADAAVEKKAPLGVLWKIRRDLGVHMVNVRETCEAVKQAQELDNFSCI